MTADCWRCRICIDLSVFSLKAPETAGERSSTTTPPVGREVSAEGVRTDHASSPLESHAVQQRRHVEPPIFCRSGPSITPMVSNRSRRRNWTRALTQLPAWLLSLLFHLLLLVVLGLLTLRPHAEYRQITLSTAVGPQDRLGGRMALSATDDSPAFDLPVPERQGQLDPALRAALVLADRDARKLRDDVRDRDLPDLSELHRALQQDGPTRTFATRDPRLRVQLVRQEGGTTMTEAAVARGLRWVAKHQAADGRWSLRRFRDHGDCDCGGRGRLSSDSAATALALLPFLGAGQTHRTGMYQTEVAAGLEWLLDHQRDDGDLRYDSDRQSGMYAHGQAAIVLCEAYAMTRDPRLRRPAQLAIQFIEDAQHKHGGWRYKPGQRGDTSVLGWQMMALQSGRAAGLRVSQATLGGAEHFLDRVMYRDGARYAYQRGERPSPTMTAEAILCRVYLGDDLDNTAMRDGLEWLVRRNPPDRREPNIYYWYYATQSLHHAGGELWREWNEQLRQLLVDTQVEQGHEAGSWDPRGPHAHAGGRIYMTALAICTLEVYYRHAPIFRPVRMVSTRR